MTGIALIADKNTVTCFKLAGLSNVHSVEDAKGAEKCLQTLLEKNNLKIVLVSEGLLNKIQIFEKIADRTGVKTQLKFSKQQIKAVGVIVKTVDGRIFVDNTFEAILSRRERELRLKIARILFSRASAS